MNTDPSNTTLGIDRQDSRDCGDDLNLDQELLTDQPIYYQQGIGRVFAARIYPGEEFVADRHEAFDVLRMHEKGGELSDVGEAESFGFKCAPRLSKTWRIWAPKSPLPTNSPASSTASCPAMNSSSEDLALAT
jgi:hypothetical protein